MVKPTQEQQRVLDQAGHVLVTGGPGSGKTTIAIQKAGLLIDKMQRPGQRALFLSFARATVTRILEAIDEEHDLSDDARRRLEVDTYHSFFWQIIKTHGYLLGLPRTLSLLAPSAHAIALSDIRSQYKRDSKLSEQEKTQKYQRVATELQRLAFEEGRVCFDLFAGLTAQLLHGSSKIRELVSGAYPAIILDEFQDTSAEQWQVVRALGRSSQLIALADPEQRIFDFIGADPARLDHFKAEFSPSVFDFAGDNHRSKGTDIAVFGNDILRGQFSKAKYDCIGLSSFASNVNQALTALHTSTLQARKRLVDAGVKSWSLAILVPTKQMTRMVSDNFRTPLGTLPVIQHTAAVDIEAVVLAAEIIAFLMQPDSEAKQFGTLIELLCAFYLGRGGDTPGVGDMNCAKAIRAAFEKALEREGAGKPIAQNSQTVPTRAAHVAVRALQLEGNPDTDWVLVRKALEASDCARLREVAVEARNIRLLDRGTELRSALSQNWRDFGAYRDALTIVRNAFVQEHFAAASRPESGVIVMNMHKAKGKQFDEVIIFEGWPRRQKGKVVANLDRIVRHNSRDGNLGQARQNLRVSITRAKRRTTILTPKDDPCVLLPGC